MRRRQACCWEIRPGVFGAVHDTVVLVVGVVAHGRDKKTIPIWYPKLQGLGESLQQDGIAVIGLTRTYYDIKEVVYYDDCCHFTPFARDLLATEVARQVGKAIENPR